MAGSLASIHSGISDYIGFINPKIEQTTILNNNGFTDRNFKLIKEVTDEEGYLKANGEVSMTTLSQETSLDQEMLNLLPGSVKHFYNGTSIFITGGTGFLGKALLEKLLRTCEGIKCIYILIRRKKGQDFKERHNALLQHQIFDRIREKWPERLVKIKSFEGDVAQPGLGLSPADCSVLEREINIVIHSAATVRFDEPLQVALTLNTLGTKGILDLCHKIKNLKSIVHVSTAYSNSDKNFEILEKFYPVDYDPEFLLQCSANFPQEILDTITPKIQGSHANTYTLTKALAERMVLKYGVGLPICIVRPSIVTAAYQEPYPGWVDNIFGPTGIMVGISLGTVRSVMCQSDGIVDLIPVDLVVNTCIAAAWHHTNYKTPEPIIYNCTTGSTNPLIWDDLAEHTLKHSIESPTSNALMYPTFNYTNNSLVHRFWELTTHFLPSLMFDVFLRLQGKKANSLKILRRFKNAADTGLYFSMNQFTFKTGNMMRMVKDLETTEETSDFYCDMTLIPWKTYIGIYMMGIRKFVMKESLDTMAAAKKKLKTLYWIQKLMELITGYFAVKMILRITDGFKKNAENRKQKKSGKP